MTPPGATNRKSDNVLPANCRCPAIGLSCPHISQQIFCLLPARSGWDSKIDVLLPLTSNYRCPAIGLSCTDFESLLGSHHTPTGSAVKRMSTHDKGGQSNRSFKFLHWRDLLQRMGQWHARPR